MAVSIGLHIDIQCIRNCHALDVASASNASTAHSGVTLIQGNRRTATSASGAAWPGQYYTAFIPPAASLYYIPGPGRGRFGVPRPGVAVHDSAGPLVRLALCSYNQTGAGLHRGQVLRGLWCVFDDGFNLTFNARPANSTSPNSGSRARRSNLITRVNLEH